MSLVKEFGNSFSGDGAQQEVMKLEVSEGLKAFGPPQSAEDR